MSSEEDEKILTKEVGSWKGFEYALRKPNATLFNKMLTECLRSIMKRYGGMGRIKDMFGSLSSPMSGNNQKPLKYYCMGCGKEHREIACPNCGPKMKRVG
jgi:rubrerythrin